MKYSTLDIFNQTLGYGGTIVSCFIKIPIIVNILRRKNYDGLSFTSMVLETSAYIAIMWYNIYRENLFYTYGDLVATVVQNSIIVILMLYFGTKGKGMSFPFFLQFLISSLLYFFFLYYMLISRQLVWLVLYGSIIPVVSRLTQVLLNFQPQGVLGVQSPYTACNSFLRPCIKLYYSVLVTHDRWLQISSVLNVLINGVLLMQVLWWLPLRSPAESVKKTA